ncbi:MAG: rod shape-determining protein MreD [Bacteroidetes bacterium]|nr:rod shape-determining protein MreD [Bacteroidota bacterium]
MIQAARYALVGVLVVALQIVFFSRLRIFGASPDAVLLFVAWFGLQFGRRFGTTCGFILGLLLDFAFDTWGIHMLLKTTLGFVIGSFSGPDREIVSVLPRQAFLGGLLVSIIHNGLLVAFLAIQAGAANNRMVGSLWIGSAVYTALLGLIAALFARR